MEADTNTAASGNEDTPITDSPAPGDPAPADPAPSDPAPADLGAGETGPGDTPSAGSTVNDETADDRQPPPPSAGPSPVRRLYRTDGPVSGVAGGLADYFGVDPVLIRLGLVAATLLGGPVVPIGYVAAWLIIPEADPAPVAPIMPPAPQHADAPTPSTPVPAPPTGVATGD